MHRKKSIVLFAIFLFLFCFGASAQDELPKDIYSASAIPDSLKSGAHAVVRYLRENYVIKAEGKIKNSMRRVITLLDNKADDEATIVLHYQRKFNSIDRIEINCYNADGKLVKKYHRNDFYDRAAVDGFSLITDDRVLILKHEFASYPATIDISVENSLSSYIDLGTVYFQRPDVATQSAVYQYKVDPAVGFRYRTVLSSIKPVKSSAEGMDTYTWSISNTKAPKDEDGAPFWSAYPHLSLAINKFVYDNKPGDLSSWKSFGQWISGLHTGVNSLSPQREEQIREMTAGLKTDKEKARFLYQYLQKNMRYVSVQLGIGGLKPFPASYVDEKKYGDCKALSNYMYALLKAVNIKSHYALVNAGENAEPAATGFANDPFNHVILCIPFAKDTTWLECTSNLQAFGKLGPFTENRNALLITDDGGKLVSTPSSFSIDNRFYAEEKISLDENGAAAGTINIDVTGGYRHDYDGLKSLSQDDQQTYLIRSWNMKQPGIFELKHVADSADKKSLNVRLEYDKLCDVSSGGKFFYRPALIGLWSLRLDSEKPRKTDFYFPHPLTKELVTYYTLPENFEIETLPSNVSLKFSYGVFSRNYVFDAEKHQIKSVAVMTIDKPRIPAAKYAEMYQFMEDIARANGRKIVIRKKA